MGSNGERGTRRGRHASARQKRRGRGGFTLPGVVAAVSLVGISVIGAQEFLGNLSREPAAEPHQLLAAEFAQTEIDDLRAIDPRSVGARSTTARVVGTDFTIASVVEETADPAEGRYIQTTVTWVDERGAPQRFALEAAARDGTR